MTGSEAFWLGARDGLEKLAAADKAQAARLIEARQKTPEATSQPKPKTKKPSRQLGLGEQTMAMGDVKQEKRPMAQPQKPPRY